MLSGVIVSCDDRWQVYRRLQELNIDCQCSSFQPLKVNLQTPTEALQLWSVVKRISEPRLVLIERLNQSWKVPF
ncbi:MAG: Asr1405/Asl0597 family protein [Cyanobacteria bacterium P01_F01_bin.53]